MKRTRRDAQDLALSSLATAIIMMRSYLDCHTILPEEFVGILPDLPPESRGSNARRAVCKAHGCGIRTI